jgi:hypothetical protein
VPANDTIFALPLISSNIQLIGDSFGKLGVASLPYILEILYEVLQPYSFSS